MNEEEGLVDSYYMRTVSYESFESYVDPADMRLLGLGLVEEHTDCCSSPRFRV